MSLELKNIHKQYGKHIIFDDLNIDFSYSGFYLLSGKSGSGKTTLLNMIAGYEPFEKRERLSDTKMACIFQSYELIPELTVLENIRMGVDLHGEVFDDGLIKKLGIEDIINHYPNELSGGQKQRVGIARALYQNPDIILCDEPTESLDIDNKEIVLSLLKEISKEKVVIVACHELSIIDPYFDYHYTIENRQLVLQEKRKPFVESETINNTISYHQPSLKRYMKRIISKRTIYAVISFCVLIILQIVVYGIDVKMFTPKTSLEALNGQVIYVNLYDVDSSYLSHVGLESKPIVAFEPINIAGKKYNINIYPLENENYLLKNNEIIINTLAVELFENESKESIIGKEINLTYKIESIEIEKIYTIKEVVEEKDAYYAQIYYDYDSLFNALSPNLQDKFISESSYYEVITHPRNTIKLYKSLSDNPRIMTNHSILDVRLENEKMMSLYHLIFQVIELIALVTTVISILYFNKKDTDKNKTALSLLYSLQVPMKDIKIVYFIEKTKYMLLGSVLIISIMIILKNWIAVSYTLVILFVYLLSLAIQILTFKARNISMILKENKD